MLRFSQKIPELVACRLSVSCPSPAGRGTGWGEAAYVNYQVCSDIEATFIITHEASPHP